MSTQDSQASRDPYIQPNNYHEVILGLMYRVALKPQRAVSCAAFEALARCGIEQYGESEYWGEIHPLPEPNEMVSVPRWALKILCTIPQANKPRTTPSNMP